VSGAVEGVWVPVQRFQLLLKPINSDALCGGYVALAIPVRGTRRWYECLPRRNGG
jgi:hypothetical protein